MVGHAGRVRDHVGVVGGLASQRLNWWCWYCICVAAATSGHSVLQAKVSIPSKVDLTVP